MHRVVNYARTYVHAPQAQGFIDRKKVSTGGQGAPDTRSVFDGVLLLHRQHIKITLAECLVCRHVIFLRCRNILQQRQRLEYPIKRDRWSSNRDRVCVSGSASGSMGEASRDIVAARLLPRLILRGKLNLNGVIKDGYQVARGSSLKYCLQIRYQLRPCPFIRPYRTLSISLAVVSHSPSANFPDSQPENALAGYTRSGRERNRSSARRQLTILTR